jgi:hypothetical protein
MPTTLLLLALWQPRDPVELAGEDCRRAWSAGRDCVMWIDEPPLGVDDGDCFDWCPPPPPLRIRRDFRAEIIAVGEEL